MDRNQYSAKWQERFAFFDEHGAPNTPEYKKALKAASSGQRIRINMNFIAFFFGLVYFFVLGLWKKNLVLLGICIGLGIVISIFEVLTGFYLPRGVDMGINIALAVMWSMSANYAYYLKEVKGIQSWNPFEGMRMI